MRPFEHHRKLLEWKIGDHPLSAARLDDIASRTELGEGRQYFVQSVYPPHPRYRLDPRIWKQFTEKLVYEEPWLRDAIQAVAYALHEERHGDSNALYDWLDAVDEVATYVVDCASRRQRNQGEST